ncbi:MAG: hypothetical protein KC933_21560 [Myxococcales bacterium]|nr:hypothetical protein [Myxococcales bacterium]
MRRVLLPLTVLLAGCPQQVVVLDDAGVGLDASGSDSGVVDTGVPEQDSGVAEQDSGIADSGSPTDAGEGPDAGGRPPSFTWTRVSLGTFDRTVYAVWGRSRGEVYLGTSAGILLRLGGGGLERLWQSPSNFDIVAIWGTPTRMFVADRSNLYVSDDGFATPPTAYSVGWSIGGMHGLSDDLVYLVAEQNSSRGLYRFNGTAVEEVASDLQVASVNGVLAEPGPQVRIASNGRVVLYDGVGTRDEAADWPPGWSTATIANFFIYDIEATGVGRFAVGSQGGILGQEQGTWHFVRDPSGSDDFETIASVGDTILAAGEPIGGHPIWWRGPQGWFPDPYAGNDVVFDAWFADGDQVFVVGFPRSSSTGLVLRGDRDP